MNKIKSVLKKIYDCPPSTYLIELNLYDYEPPKGIKDFITHLIACIPILCILQSILWTKQIKREARIFRNIIIKRKIQELKRLRQHIYQRYFLGE